MTRHWWGWEVHIWGPSPFPLEKNQLWLRGGLRGLGHDLWVSSFRERDGATIHFDLWFRSTLGTPQDSSVPESTSTGIAFKDALRAELRNRLNAQGNSSQAQVTLYTLSRSRGGFFEFLRPLSSSP